MLNRVHSDVGLSAESGSILFSQCCKVQGDAAGHGQPPPGAEPSAPRTTIRCRCATTVLAPTTTRILLHTNSHHQKQTTTTRCWDNLLRIFSVLVPHQMVVVAANKTVVVPMEGAEEDDGQEEHAQQATLTWELTTQELEAIPMVQGDEFV
eukprot:TRINITY_DN66132_c7_g1_i1.p2 TRINITY_DN66132_c7_g1~~TRINITY_DN66132_c7_g1_i1.p2  ORF type:complete len:151 (+),score=23.72 TRINITY_DN66132_c7_g1_i1:1045-1497(+)